MAKKDKLPRRGSVYPRRKAEPELKEGEYKGRTTGKTIKTIKTKRGEELVQLGGFRSPQSAYRYIISQKLRDWEIEKLKKAIRKPVEELTWADLEGMERKIKAGRRPAKPPTMKKRKVPVMGAKGGEITEL